ncbi:DUF4097 family beta strand repeat-containing protein [Streptomyces sp. NPDC002851]
MTEPPETSWQVAEPRTLTFERPPALVSVRVANGAVNVVGTDDTTARLEISEVVGTPLTVTHEGATLTVAYDDLPWKGFLKWLAPKGWRRSAVVSLAVPAGTAVEVGVVSAHAVVSGITGRTSVKGVNGDTTLVGLSGDVRAETVSGSIETQGTAGELRFNTVSGGLTMLDTAGAAVRAESVSGPMVVDFAPRVPAADVRLHTVSGEIAVRLPDPVDTIVEADSASGRISSAFPELHSGRGGEWGTSWRLSGRLGEGTGLLHASTVSGSIALLRRPDDDDDAPADGDTSADGGATTGKVL